MEKSVFRKEENDIAILLEECSVTQVHHRMLQREFSIMETKKKTYRRRFI